MEAPDFLLPRPPLDSSPEKQRAFDDLWQSRPEGGFLNYHLPYPKWQFLSYLCESRELVLHGSQDVGIGIVEPRQANDTKAFSNQRAIYATTDGIWVIYFAILDRQKHRGLSLFNSCLRARIAVDNDLWVLADEIYSRIIYEADFESVTQFPGMQERTIILDGMSKTYAMTGWRLGYGVMNEKMAAAVARLQTNATSCTSAFSQIAIGAAITGPQDDSYKMVDEFRKRRDVIVEGLNGIEGISCKKPLGAFYVFPNVKQLKMTSKNLEELLLEEYGVAALAGTSFGSFGEGYLRFSYANSVENIKKALSRVNEAAAEILKKA